MPRECLEPPNTYAHRERGFDSDYDRKIGTALDFASARHHYRRDVYRRDRPARRRQAHRSVACECVGHMDRCRRALRARRALHARDSVVAHAAVDGLADRFPRRAADISRKFCAQQRHAATPWRCRSRVRLHRSIGDDAVAHNGHARYRACARPPRRDRNERSRRSSVAPGCVAAEPSNRTAGRNRFTRRDLPWRLRLEQSAARRARVECMLRRRTALRPTRGRPTAAARSTRGDFAERVTARLARPRSPYNRRLGCGSAGLRHGCGVDRTRR